MIFFFHPPSGCSCGVLLNSSSPDGFVERARRFYPAFAGFSFARPQFLLPLLAAEKILLFFSQKSRPGSALTFSRMTTRTLRAPTPVNCCVSFSVFPTSLAVRPLSPYFLACAVSFQTIPPPYSRKTLFFFPSSTSCPRLQRPHSSTRSAIPFLYCRLLPRPQSPHSPTSQTL